VSRFYCTLKDKPLEDLSKALVSLASINPEEYSVTQINQAITLLEELDRRGQFNFTLPPQKALRIIASYNKWFIPLHTGTKEYDNKDFSPFTHSVSVFQPATPSPAGPLVNRALCSDQNALETIRQQIGESVGVKGWDSHMITGVEALSSHYCGSGNGLPFSLNPKSKNVTSAEFTSFLVLNPLVHQKYIVWPKETFPLLNLWSTCIRTERKIASSLPHRTSIPPSCGNSYPVTDSASLLGIFQGGGVGIYYSKQSGKRVLALFTAPDLAVEAYNSIQNSVNQQINPDHCPFGAIPVNTAVSLLKKQNGFDEAVLNPKFEKEFVNMTAPVSYDAHTLQNLLLDDQVIDILSRKL